MVVGVPKEIKANEKRVALLPHLVKSIINLGHEVVIQKNAGLESGIDDKSYIEEGAKILDSIDSFETTFL